MPVDLPLMSQVQVLSSPTRASRTSDSAPIEPHVVAELRRHDLDARGLASESQLLHGFARGLEQPIALAHGDATADDDPLRD